ncbi:PhzF family phenazine biosynthesis protein [candidate division KSB1 bacterium]
MKKVKIKQVDAFTEIPFSGNPAGVVTAASGLTVKQMRMIAREMNLSETAFIIPPKTTSAHMEIRWFTPTAEVDLCGHATIAAFYALAEEQKYGMNRPGKYSFNVVTRSGILPVTVDIKKNRPVTVSFGLPVPEFENFLYDEKILAEALGTSHGNFNFDYPLAKDRFQIIVPIKKRKHLFDLRPNYPLIEDISRETNTAAVTVFTTDTVDKNSTVHTRCFVPLFGVNEDPVTGSSLGPLGVYLADNGIVKSSGGRISYVAEQGDCLDKAGRVNVDLRKGREGYHSLTISGNAVTVLEGEIRLV